MMDFHLELRFNSAPAVPRSGVCAQVVIQQNTWPFLKLPEISVYGTTVFKG